MTMLDFLFHQTSLNAIIRGDQIYSAAGFGSSAAGAASVAGASAGAAELSAAGSASEEVQRVCKSIC